MDQRRLLFILKLVPIVCLIYFIHLAVRQALFERFLASSSISFDDFPRDYGNALVLATAADEELDYDFSSYPSSPSPEHDIPPTIHFIFFENLYETHPDRTLIPSSGSRAPEVCRDHNPDFTITTWDASAARELLETHYPWFLPTYDSYRYPIQRVDAFKYFVLYHFGGIYMDLDVACRRPLKPLMGFPAWFAKGGSLWVGNDLIASRAGHPVMGRMIHGLADRNKWLVLPYLTVFWSTGPEFAADMFKEWWFDGGARGKDSDVVRVLPQEFYSEQYTFFGHSPGGTWHGGDVAVVLWLLERPWVPVCIAGIMLIIGVMLMVRGRGVGHRRGCMV